MIGWAILFLIVAIVAGVFAFGGFVLVSAELAKIVFFAAIAMFAIPAVAGLVYDHSPHAP